MIFKISKVKVSLFLAVLMFMPVFSVQAETENKNVRILVYHTFMGDKNIYSFSHEEVKRQCEELIADGYRFITYDDFRQGNYSGERNVLVTIDDGHQTVYEAYRKIFAPLGIKPLLSIYPAIIGKKKFALTWEKINEMLKDGCSVASHGYYHNFVNESAFKKDRKSVETEIIKSKRVLEEKLGRTIDTFVYPFGAYSDMTMDALKKAGYSYAMTIKGGHASISSGSAANYELPRYLLTRQRITRLSRLFGDKKQRKVIPTAVAANYDIKANKNAAAVDTEVAAEICVKTNETSGFGAAVSASPLYKPEVFKSLKTKIFSIMTSLNKTRLSLMEIMSRRLASVGKNIKDFFQKLS